MTIYKNFDTTTEDFAACIGFFDGVHRGHQFLLQHLREEASKHGLKSAVITFANHPRKLLQPDYDLLLIDTLEERLNKLEALGLDACFLLDFTEEIRNLTAKQFIQDILAQQCHVRLLIIGYDHRFGRNRSEGFEDYVRYGAECGMKVLQEPVFDDGSGLNYSSSEIRRALKAGNMDLANQLLGTK